jgi:hypothetical protein
MSVDDSWMLIAWRQVRLYREVVLGDEPDYRAGQPRESPMIFSILNLMRNERNSTQKLLAPSPPRAVLLVRLAV